jgi:phosphoglycerate dehydrogenase-like enzyme
MERVLIAPMTLADVGGAFVEVLRGAGFELVYPGAGHQLTEDELFAALDGVTAAVAGSEPYTPRVLAAHPGLKVVARVGVGYDAVDLPAATANGTAVTIAPNTNQEAVAEHTFALMLALVKDVVNQDRGTREGRWPRRIHLPLRGHTLGLVGLGRIGKAVATRALAFNMRVVAYDPFPDGAFASAHGIPLLPLEQLLRESDFVSLHLPATKETRHLINRRTLALMRPTAFLVNTARGALINEADLTASLKAKRLAGAGLDVFEEEPPGRLELFGLDNVVVTPHAAGGDFRSRDDMALSAAEAIAALKRGEWPGEKVVNPAVRERFRW